MLETFSGNPAVDGKLRPVARLVFAEHDGRVLAANLMMYFGDTAIYLHGASSRTRREVMAPQRLPRRRQVLGLSSLGLGRRPEEQKIIRAGITRFKRGFGGKYVSYAGTYDNRAVSGTAIFFTRFLRLKNYMLQPIMNGQ
jgi:lipid II:glycine glycyltransferase (peptidoglycan interpeptide bridge formation enzyme)